jgi:hypothetical protein
MYTIFKFVKYCKILISCTNNDQIPYFCQVYIPDIIYKMHEGEIDSPHKDPFLFWVQKICKYLLKFVYSIQAEIYIKKKIYN